MYQDTLDLYKLVFIDSPPDHIWQTVEDRFLPSNFAFKIVNFYRLATLYSLKAVNPNFLAVPLAAPVNKNKKINEVKLKIK